MIWAVLYQLLEEIYKSLLLLYHPVQWNFASLIDRGKGIISIIKI